MVRYAGEWAAYFATAALRWRLSSSSSSGGGGSGLASLPALSVRAQARRPVPHVSQPDRVADLCCSSAEPPRASAGACCRPSCGCVAVAVVLVLVARVVVVAALSPRADARATAGALREGLLGPGQWRQLE